MTKRNTIEILESQTDKSGFKGCWLWKGHKNSKGYGRVKWRGKTRLVHVIFYEEKYGAVPKGFELGHTCHNESCVCPDHVRPITHLQNVRENKEATKMFCKNGHARMPENIEVYHRKDGVGVAYKRCLVCYAIRYPGTAKRKPKK